MLSFSQMKTRFLRPETVSKVWFFLFYFFFIIEMITRSDKSDKNKEIQKTWKCRIKLTLNLNISRFKCIKFSNCKNYFHFSGLLKQAGEIMKQLISKFKILWRLLKEFSFGSWINLNKIHIYLPYVPKCNDAFFFLSVTLLEYPNGINSTTIGTEAHGDCV